MKPEEALSKKRNEIIQIAAKYGAGNLRVFGSVARGESDDRSDIDILVDMQPDKSLLDLAGLLIELRKALGVKVDVFTESSLKPRIRERALKESVPL
jgi:uncharacterized protein